MSLAYKYERKYSPFNSTPSGFFFVPRVPLSSLTLVLTLFARSTPNQRLTSLTLHPHHNALHLCYHPPWRCRLFICEPFPSSSWYVGFSPAYKDTLVISLSLRFLPFAVEVTFHLESFIFPSPVSAPSRVKNCFMNLVPRSRSSRLFLSYHMS